MSQDGWYYAEGREHRGPMTRSELVAAIRDIEGDRTLIYGPGVASWLQTRHVPAVSAELGGIGNILDGDNF